MKAGSIAVGDEVTAPHGRTTTVTNIDTTDGPADAARAGDSIVLRLADEIDLARGDLLAAGPRPEPVREFAATAVVLTEKDLTPGQMLKLRYGAAQVKARITSVDRILDLDGVADTDNPEKATLNDIAHITLQTAQELPVEDYAARGAVGNFLLIDQSSGNTLAAGFVGQRLR